MSGPDPSPMSIASAIKPWCIFAPPWNDGISASMPCLARMPVSTATSIGVKANTFGTDLPTRILSAASAGADSARTAQASDRSFTIRISSSHFRQIFFGDELRHVGFGLQHLELDEGSRQRLQRLWVELPVAREHRHDRVVLLLFHRLGIVGDRARHADGL